MNETYRFLLQKTFDIDFNQDINEILRSFEKELKNEKCLKTEVYRVKEKSELTLLYYFEPKIDKVTRLCTFMGLPNKQFDRAEKVYWQKVKAAEGYRRYILRGDTAAGTLAQYAGLMSGGYVVIIE